METVRKIDHQTYRQALDRRSPSQSQLDQIWDRLAASYDHLAGRGQITSRSHMACPSQTSKGDQLADQGQPANADRLANREQVFGRGQNPQGRRKEDPPMTLIEEEKTR